MEYDKKMKVIVIAAHPDDEILGVGGTICRHVKNKDEVYVCVVTKACKPMWSDKYMIKKVVEQNKVDKLMGIKKRFNLNLPTVKLNTMPHGELNSKVALIVDKVKPDIIYTHYENDLNYDHTLVFRATMVAARPPKRIKILCYETLSETEWGVGRFAANVWIDISEHMKKKVKAFQIYKSEVKKYPHPRSSEGIRVLAKKRGTEACIKYAEAFVMLRDILD